MEKTMCISVCILPFMWLLYNIPQNYGVFMPVIVVFTKGYQTA